MKKKAVVLFFLAMMIFSVTALASAQSVTSAPDPFAFTSKAEFYYAIELRLNTIKQALANNNLQEAEKAFEELRLIVYRCARFLADHTEYDVRIMNVVVWSKASFEQGANYNKLLEDARILACQILMDKCTGPETPGDYSYPYLGAVEDAAPADEDSGDDGGSSQHS